MDANSPNTALPLPSRRMRCQFELVVVCVDALACVFYRPKIRPPCLRAPLFLGARLLPHVSPEIYLTQGTALFVRMHACTPRNLSTTGYCVSANEDTPTTHHLTSSNGRVQKVGGGSTRLLSSPSGSIQYLRNPPSSASSPSPHRMSLWMAALRRCAVDWKESLHTSTWYKIIVGMSSEGARGLGGWGGGNVTVGRSVTGLHPPPRHSHQE